MSTSLIITTYHWPAGLNVVLARDEKQSRLPDEVIITDDGSGQATRDLVLHPHFVADHLAIAEPDCLVTGKRIKMGPKLSSKVLSGIGQPNLLSRGIARGRKLALRSRWLSQRCGWGTRG